MFLVQRIAKMLRNKYIISVHLTASVCTSFMVSLIIYEQWWQIVNNCQFPIYCFFNNKSLNLNECLEKSKKSNCNLQPAIRHCLSKLRTTSSNHNYISGDTTVSYFFYTTILWGLGQRSECIQWGKYTLTRTFFLSIGFTTSPT